MITSLAEMLIESLIKLWSNDRKYNDKFLGTSQTEIMTS